MVVQSKNIQKEDIYTTPLRPLRQFIKKENVEDQISPSLPILPHVSGNIPNPKFYIYKTHLCVTQFEWNENLAKSLCCNIKISMGNSCIGNF